MFYVPDISVFVNVLYELKKKVYSAIVESIPEIPIHSS